MRPYLLIAVTLAVCIAAAENGWAQSGNPLPSTVEPGRRDRPAPSAPVAPLRLQWTIELPPGPSVPRRMANQQLDLNSLTLAGVTAYRGDELRDIYRPYLGKTITFADFYGIAQKIQARYHRDGYVLSFAYVPPQKVEDGKFRITVVEGYIRKLNIVGIKGDTRKWLRSMLAPILRSRPLNTKILERYLLIVRDLAGFSVTGILRRAPKGVGASDLTVKIRHRHLAGSAVLDNRGSEFVGPWRTGVSMTASSLWHRGSQVTARARTASPTSELKSFSLEGSVPLASEGLTLGAGLGYVASTPGAALALSQTDTSSITADLTASYPVVRSRDQSLRLRAGFSYLDAAVKAFGELLTNDRIRTINAGLTYTQSGFLRGGTGFRADVVQSLPVLWASTADEMSRADADTTYTKLTFDLARTQLLYGRFQLGLGAAGQLARTALPASAEFAVGGARFGRAYDAGIITGEDGVSASAELRYAWRAPSGFVRRFTPYAYYDYGKVWDTATPSSLGQSESLASAGGGLRMMFARGISFGVEYAHPISRTPAPATEDAARISVLLSARF